MLIRSHWIRQVPSGVFKKPVMNVTGFKPTESCLHLSLICMTPFVEVKGEESFKTRGVCLCVFVCVCVWMWGKKSEPKRDCVCMGVYESDRARERGREWRAAGKKINKKNSPKQAMFPSNPMYLRSHLAASVSVGSLSDMSSMAKTAFCLNSALSSKFILASKHTTIEEK